MPEETWMELCNTVQEAIIQTIHQKKKCKKLKMISGTKNNWFEPALSSSTADVYLTGELPGTVDGPWINPAVLCVESATQTCKYLAWKQSQGIEEMC